MIKLFPKIKTIWDEYRLTLNSINDIEDELITLSNNELKSRTAKLKYFASQKGILDQKTLIVVSKKSTYLKKVTQNLKNVELICASNLNTLSLLKAKQILITPSARNDIKEIYCE